MKIMRTMTSEAIAQRHTQRYYGPEFKSQVMAEFHIAGASVAGVASVHSINATIVHRWLIEQSAQLKIGP